MRRTVALLVLALLVAGCGSDLVGQPVAIPSPAEPRTVEPGWREVYPDGRGHRLRFVVDELAVTSSGWRAEVAVSNLTRIPFEAGKRPVELTYGLMLFRTGTLSELEDAASSGGLPAVRKAVTIEPRPPAVLRPGATWRATIAAPGSLPAGAFARVVFGPLRAVGDPPEGVETVVVWITDHSYRL
ncbi:MAG: hypothetical protein ACXWZB_06805 [Gaiellaceae bacterium]